MGDKIVLPSGVLAELAEYKYQEISDYRNNPLIEALPLIMDKMEVIDRLTVYPTISEEEKFLKPHLRFHIIQRLFSYFQPLSITIELEAKISRLLRQGYLARNPFNPNFVKSVNAEHLALSNNVEICCNELFRSTASSFTIIGNSGMGKTSSVNRVLSNIPQVLIHNEYKGNKISLYQLVWIKLDCPNDGSIKNLLLDFFSKVDSVLGSSYYSKYSTGRVSTSGMIPAISMIARQCSIGMIILDELQNLNMGRSGGANKVLNFICTLINTVGVPILMIGTPKSMPLLSKEFRLARRSEGVGGLFFDRMKKDESFNILLEGLWEYQWTKNYSELNQEYIDLMFLESQGITDILIKLFVATQLRAISSGKEEISPALIKKVAKENFNFVRGMLNDLRSGNINKIGVYDDLMEINIDGFLNNELNKINMNSKIKEAKELKKQSKENILIDIREQSILKLIDLDIEEKEAVKLVSKYLKNEKNDLSVSQVVKEILMNFNSKEKEEKVVVSKPKVHDEKDLRVIVQVGKEKGIKNYSSIKAYGFIKTIDEVMA